MRSTKGLWIAGIVVLVAIFVWKSLNIYTEWLWISQVGYASVFVTLYKTRGILLLIVGLCFFFWVWGNCRIARRATSEDITFIGKRLLPPAERAAIEQHVDKIIIIVSILVGGVAAILASHRALPLLQFLNSTSFGATDPIFGKDLGFYVFQLPFIEYIWSAIFQGLLLTLVLVALVYVYEESVRVAPGTVYLAPHARLHVYALLAAALVWRAGGFWLDRFKLLTSRGSDEAVFGIGYTDLYARIPVLYFLMAAALVGAVVVIVAIRRLNVRVVGMAIAGVMIFWLLGRWAAPAVVQAIVVKPSELQRETRFLRYNIDATREAYGLSNVRVEPYEVTPLSAEQVAANPATINNLRLWDDRPMETVANQVHQLRPYYEFSDVDVDRYEIDGQMRQVMLAARQLNIEAVPSPTWVNTHMQYTHGYGVVLAPVNEIAENGRPDFFIKDIPPPYPPLPGLEALGLPLARAGLYYQVAVEREMPPPPPAGPGGEGPGEEAPPPPPSESREGETRRARRGTRPVERAQTTIDYCIVGGVGDEFDYPRNASEGEEGNARTRYDGKGGVPLSSFFRRFAFFAKFHSWPILFSSDITRDSRILVHRTVHERIGSIAPFLLLDWDPYLVIADEKLQWLTDAYTASTRYPYAEQPVLSGRRFNVNYLRNSVKVSIDAYDGSVDFFVFDEKDPVLQTYRKIFPDMFKGRDDMPGSLQAHVRYPEGLFRIQTQMYQLYHMKDEETFYLQEDRWSFPAEEFAGRRQEMEAYYVVMTLPDRAGGPPASEGSEEFLIMTPFTPHMKSDRNMLAWMAARCDPEHYGELIVYAFPKDRMIQGPMMVEVAIGADGEISEMETLWGGTGSSVIRGNLLVIPIDNAILYVEPLYVQAVRSGIPELRIVIVGANDQITWGATLQEAMGKMFGGGAMATVSTPSAPGEVVTPAQGETPEIAKLVREVYDQYKRAEQALRTEGFAGYEREQKELGRLIERLMQQTAPERAGALEPEAAEPAE